MKLNKNIQFFAPPPAVIDSNIIGWLNNDKTGTTNLSFSSADSSGTISLSADGKTITFSEFNDEYQLNSNIQNNGIYSNGVLTLNTPITAIYSDTTFSSVLLNRGETKSYPLAFNCYVKWETSAQTTLDLSTLSDITDGTHTVKVKAKANGYRDSEFSNEVSYTKAAVIQTFSGTISNDGGNSVRYGIDDGSFRDIRGYNQEKVTVRTDQIVTIVGYGGNSCTINSSNGVNIIPNSSYITFSPTANNFSVNVSAK